MADATCRGRAVRSAAASVWRMSEKISVGIVGAGAVGLSAALALTELGVEEVIVLDSSHVASGSSGRSVGVVETQYVDPLRHRPASARQAGVRGARARARAALHAQRLPANRTHRRGRPALRAQRRGAARAGDRGRRGPRSRGDRQALPRRPQRRRQRGPLRPQRRVRRRPSLLRRCWPSWPAPKARASSSGRG